MTDLATPKQQFRELVEPLIQSRDDIGLEWALVGWQTEHPGNTQFAQDILRDICIKWMAEILDEQSPDIQQHWEGHGRIGAAPGMIVSWL